MATDAIKQTVARVQDIVYEMLCSIDDYCRENNILYFLSGGTCLGAVRHKGFIPWDDDGDLMLPREDYERFITGFGAWSDGRYQVGALEVDPSWHRPACKVWDTRTQLIQTKFRERPMGVFIDVFPIDGLPEAHWQQSLYYRKIKLLEALRNSSIRKDFYADEKYRAIKKVLGLFTRRMDPRRLALRIDREALKHPFASSAQVAVSLALHYGERETIARECMSSAVYLPFRDRQFPVPAGYEQYLHNLYGDYMVIPKDAAEKGFDHLEGWDLRILDDSDNTGSKG